MNRPEKQSDILRCARYAFRPNKLKYCGPDENKFLFEYLEAGEDDGGLCGILEKFETLFPYLKLIAAENKTADPFQKNISNAYWIGSELLENVKMSRLYEHLAGGLKLKKKLSGKEMEIVAGKMPRGANPHHSFHVFNIWQRTGHIENPHTLFTMDECRIGWGSVSSIVGDLITVMYEPLEFRGGKLAFGAPAAKNIFYELRDIAVKPGDWISFHWSSFCEVLKPEDLANLKKWTTINLELANYAR
jgi:hypothetical protein